MGKDVEKEVVDVLSSTEDIDFENLQAEELSPLNQAVIEKEIAGVSKPNDWNVWKPGNKPVETMENNSDKEQGSIAHENSTIRDEHPLDAPEQEFGGGNEDDTNLGDDNSQDTIETENKEFELPTASAKQASNTILGVANNVLAVGGGFFIKIKKHKEFYEFDDIIELIDAQNEKNIKRVQLDKEDKALLKPIIVAILKKKAKTLTPEQQLIGAILSILIKKGQVVMEVRAENDVLVERILDIVREEKGYSESNVENGESEDEIPDMVQDEFSGTSENKKEDIPVEEAEVVNPIEVESTYDDEPQIMDAIIEVAEDESKE